jgi:hypothetical protein
MADAMKAQMQQLLGQGEYAQMYTDAGFAGGDLGDIIQAVEGPIRQQTAQVDTDVLRQTLLGNTIKGGKKEVTYDSEGRAVSGFTEPGKVGIRAVVLNTKGVQVDMTQTSKALQPQVSNGSIYYELVDGDGNVIESTDKKVLPAYNRSNPFFSGPISLGNGGVATDLMDELVEKMDANPNIDEDLVASIKEQREGVDRFDDRIMAGNDHPQNPQPLGGGQNSFDGTDAMPIYARNSEGEIIQDAEKANMTEVIDLPTTREGDGMIDLLGDRRNVQEFTTRQATQEDVDAKLASEVGETITVQTGNRQAGFDETGKFLGLSAMAEDIQRGNLSRQREADLADVERLSDRFQTVMEDYKPATTTGIQGARDLIEEQKENLTSGDPTITIPTDSTYGGDVTGQTMTAATVADPLQLEANTQFDQELGREGDTLRQALLGDARTALDSGLTDREQAQIANAARARSTLMGRTFDQSGAIAEAEARVQEDNARRMQNRGFAQSVLGQEAGLQQGDITRGMAQESEQAGLQQQANLAQAQMDQQASAFDADAAMRAATINQGQAQQAAQFGVGAQMDAERLNESLRQQGLGNYISAVGNLAQIEEQHTLDPFQAILGRAGGGSLQAGQGVFGQAGYGLNSGPQYLNPEAGLGYISNMAANQANMYAAQLSADATRDAGMMNMFGNIGGAGLGAAIKRCWVAREVYGPTNPAWLLFRNWLDTESPNWFRNLYIEYGERFAQWISNKPRIKSIIRKWMDSKIGGK